MTEDTIRALGEREKLEELWKLVDSGRSSSQDRIDAVTLAGRLGDRAAVPRVWRLTADEDEEVRYYALQTLVLDLRAKTGETADLCWRLLERDRDEDVQSMAAACLGSIFLGTNRVDVFQRLAEKLRSRSVSGFVKSSIYGALFSLAGRPPAEWPNLMGPRRVFDETHIDRQKVAELEDEVRKAALSR